MTFNLAIYARGMIGLVFFIFAAEWAGRIFLKASFLQIKGDFLWRRIFNLLCGFMIISFLLAWLGMARYWKPGILFCVFTVFVAAAVWRVIVKIKYIRLDSVLWRKILSWFPVLFIFTLTLLNSCVPTSDNDAMMYHLDLIKDYWLHSGFCEIKNWEYQFFPLGFQMLYLPGEVLCFPQWANFINAIAALLLILVLKQLLEMDVPGVISRVGVMLFLYFFYTLPDIFYQAFNPRIDLPFALYVGFLLVLAHEYLKSQDKHYLYICALVLGFILSIKYHGFVIAAIFYSIIGAYALFSKKLKLVDIVKCIGLTFAVFLPWMIKNIIYGGNPLRPLLAQFLTRGDFSVQGQVDFVRNALYCYVPINRTLWSLPRDLLLFNFLPQKFCSAYVSPVFITFVPFAFKYLRERSFYAALLVSSIIYTVAWYFSSPVSRFLLPAFLIWTILIYRLINERAWQPLKTISIIIIFLWCGLITTNCLRASFKKIKYLADPDQYLVDYTNKYDVLKVANGINTDKLFAVYDSMKYYLNKKGLNMATLAGYGLCNLETLGSKSPELKRRNIGYLILNNNAYRSMRNGHNFKLLSQGKEFSLLEVL